MPGQSPRDFAEWMQKVERQSKAAMRNSSYAVQSTREAVIRVIDEVMPGTPTAPVEITHQTSLYKNTSGAWRARLDVDFPDVTLTVDQKPVTVSGYELYGYEVDLYAEAEPVWEQYGGSDNVSSITRMDLPPGVEYMMKVRAVGGIWSSEFRVFTSADTVPPPQPTAPTAEVFLGAITVKWDKKAVTGDMPADFEAAILCVGDEPSPGLDKAVTRFDMHESIFVITGAEYYKPVFIRLIAVDTSGNLSPWSEQATAMTKPLVDADIILAEIDAGKTRIKNASQIVLENDVRLGEKLQEADTAIAEAEKRLTGPGGLTERLTDAEALLADAGSLGWAEGQTLRQKLTAADVSIKATQDQLNTVRNTTLPKLVQDLGAAEGRLGQAEGDLAVAERDIDTAKSSLAALTKRVSPLETGLTTLNKTTIPGLQTSINGKNGTVNSTDIPSEASEYSPGDRWQMWDTLGPGGKLLKTFRHTDAVWREEIFDPTYLPLVDIGSGTFGSLNGGRVATKSLSTDALLVGDFTNYVDDPNAEGPGWEILPNFQDSVRRSSLTYAGQMVGGWVLSPTDGVRVSNRNWFTVEADTELYLEATVSNRTNAPLYYRVEWRDSAGSASTTPTYHDVTFPARPDGDTNWSTLSRSVTPPAGARQGRMVFVQGALATSGSAYCIFPSARRKNAGNLIVAGTITGEHVDAESVAAKVGNFVKINVENITATENATLNNVVAQRIAAGTAAFQTVDAKNLFVTGTSSLEEVVARRLAAETGTFIKLGVDQLTVSGTANMETAVADRIFANIFTSNKVNATQISVSDFTNYAPSLADSVNDWIMNGGMRVIATNFSDANEGFRFDTVETDVANAYGPTRAAVPGDRFTASMTVWRASTRTVHLYWEFYDKAMALVTLSAQSQASTGSGKFTNEATAPAGTAFVRLRVRFGEGSGQVGAYSVNGFRQVGATLIEPGAITTEHITVTQELSAKIGSFLKVDVSDLVVTKNANIAEATVAKLWGDVLNYRKITTNQLAISPQNFMPDPMHQDDVIVRERALRADGTWTTVKTDPDSAYTGGFLRQDNFNAGAVVRFSPVEADPDLRVPVTPGKQILVEIQYRYRGVASGSATNSMQIQAWYDTAAKAYTTFQQGPMDTSVQGVSAHWQTISYTFTAPEGVAFIRIGLRVFNPRSMRTEVGQAVVRERTDSELIVDGAITTKKLTVTEDMTAALLKAKKVEAIEIDVNSLKSDSAWIGSLRTGILVTDVVTSTHIKSDSITATLLKADAITSKHTLTGPLIRSAASGARTEMNNQGIRVLNSSNVELIRLGYGIGTGMSIRNPVNGVLAPLANMVFGVETFSSTVPLDYSGSGQVYAPDTFNYGPRYVPRTSSANYEYTAVSESAILMWEAVVLIWNTNTNASTREYVPFELGMNVFNLTGTPGELVNVGSFGRHVVSWTRTQSGTPATGSSPSSVQGHGVVTGMTPGSKYRVPVYLKAPTYQSGAGGFGVLNARVTDIRLVIIPR